MKRFLGFLRTTAIGGLLFLLPLIVIGALVGQAVPIVMKVAQALGKWLPVKTPGGITILVLLSIASLLMLCFFVGLLARRSFGKRLLASFEKNLTLLFPRYSIFKDQMSGTLGGTEEGEPMRPVLVQFDDHAQIGFALEEYQSSWITYFPGAPDPWAGEVLIVDGDRIKFLDSDFKDTVDLFEKLGRDASRIIAGRPAPDDAEENEEAAATQDNDEPANDEEAS